MVGDIKYLLDKLTQAAVARDISPWWQTIAKWKDDNAINYETERLTAPWIMKHISEATAGQEVIFATDVGQHQMWAAQHLSIEKPGCWITSGGLGAMGFGLPAAMGAQVGGGDARVIAIAGDGGFKMTAMELYTIAAYDLPVICIVIDNNCLGMVRQWQQLFFPGALFGKPAAGKLRFYRPCPLVRCRSRQSGQYRRI